MSSIWSTGWNSYGQLGLNDEVDRDEFTRIGELTTWSSVACSNSNGHTVAIKSDGTMWSCGNNNKGQLGLNDTNKRDEFTQVGSDTTWESVSCGYEHSMAIKTGGTLWGTGEAYPGQQGRGDTIDKQVFTQVGTDTTWSKVVCGYNLTFAIKVNGTLWATGYNVWSNLGIGNSNYTTSFTQSGSATTWTDIACGSEHAVGIRSDGTLWGVGYDRWGRCGLGSIGEVTNWTQVGTDTTWSSVSCGDAHSTVIKTDGTIWSTGRNTYGQLGLGDYTGRTVFTQIGVDTSWSGVNCGYWCALAAKTNGTLWGTGYNSNGQLGLNDTTNKTTFTQIDDVDEPSSFSTSGIHSVIIFDVAEPPTIGKHIGIMGLNGGVLFDEKTIIGDEHGKLYALNMNTYTDNGQSITRSRRTQIINKERLHIVYNKIEINFQIGVGLDVAEGVAGEDPEVLLKWSDDGGNTWSTDITTSLGKYQEYLVRAIWRRLGKSRNRVYELTITSPVKFIILGAFSDIEACES